MHSKLTANAVSPPVDDNLSVPKKAPRSIVGWILRGLGVAVVGVVAIFVWGYFQPKPPGFTPTDLEHEAAVIDGWTQYTIDATSREEWVFFDFAQGHSIEATFARTEWSMAFKRTDLRTNSGITNPDGLGGAVNLGERSPDEAVPSISDILTADQAGEDDPDEVTNPAIDRWYSYNFITHTVHAGSDTYLVRSGDGHDALVRFDSYYCEDESPGCITFRYRVVPAAEGS